jgi:phage terminase large subunit GpA-like protein
MSSQKQLYRDWHPGLLNVVRKSLKALKPPEKLTLSDWAEKYAYLSPENSATPGKWHNIPYQVGIMDAVTDPTVREISVMKSARVGYTKIIDHAIAYFIHQDPSPILMVQPTIEDAKGYSKDEFDPMIRDTPVLAELFTKASRQDLVKSEKEKPVKDQEQTIQSKSFPGGKLYFVGANSPRGFRRITVRVVLFDEVDGYPVEGAGDEGDQIALGKKRAQTFDNALFLKGSTPTIKGVSRIEREFLAGDQRHFYVPCPHCGVMQTLEFNDKKKHLGYSQAVLRWPEGKPHEAYFECSTGCIIEEKQKVRMLEQGQWIAHAEFNGHASFFIWAGYSVFANASWGNIAAEFVEAKKDPVTLRVFVNTVLGETWEEKGETVDENWLAQRRETYDAEVPAGALVLTAGVDIQADRIECEVRGWGIAEESWGIEYRIFYGDTSQGDVWQALDDYLGTRFRHENGHDLTIASVFIDAKYQTQMVYDYVRPRQGRRIYAINGQDGAGRPIVKRVSAKRKGKDRRDVDLVHIGVDTAKDMIYARLRMPEPGPGYYHFPDDYDAEYFSQLTAEQAKIKFSKGFAYRVWEKTRARNEALDVNVYALAAMKMLNPNFEAWAERLKPPEPENQKAPVTFKRVVSRGVEL